MAVRFDADAEDYSRAASLGAQAQWSMSCWVKISVNRGTYTTVWNFDGGSSQDYAYLQTVDDGTTMEFHQASSGSDTGALASRALTVGVWYYFGISVNGASGTMVSKALGDVSFTVSTWTAGRPSTTHTNFRIGKSAFTGEWLNGAISAVKLWSATLSQAELEAEAAQFAPVRAANLHAYYRFASPSTVDDSGNGQTLSGGAGTSTEADPAIGPVVRSNTFNGGTAGSAITAANSGGASGDAFNNIVGSPQYSNAVAHRGGLVAANSVAGSDTHIDWTNVTQPGTTICGRMYIYRTGTPADPKGVWALIGPLGIVSKAWIFASGFIDIYTGVADTYVRGNNVAVPVGQWARLEWRYTIDGSGNGTVEMWTYLNADSAVHDDYVISSTVAWPGGKPRDVEFHIGRDSTSQTYVDEVGVSDVKIGSAVPQIAAPVGTVTETDTARPIIARKADHVAQAVTVEAALPIRPVKVVPVGQVVEADATGTVLGRKLRTVGQVVESDTAAQVAPAHRRIIGQVVETDTAAEITPGAGIRRVVESDIALPIQPVKIGHVGQVVETSTASPAAAAHRVAIGQVVETSAASTLHRIKIRRIGQVVETDTARLIGSKRLLRVIESDLALPITPVKYRRRPMKAGQPCIGWSAGPAHTHWVAGQPRTTWSAGSPRM